MKMVRGLVKKVLTLTRAVKSSTPFRSQISDLRFQNAELGVASGKVLLKSEI
jgi:hypothetical protein